MVGRIPRVLHPGLIGRNGILAIFSEPVELMEITTVTHPNSRGGVAFFNWVASGERLREEESIRGMDFDVWWLREDIVYQNTASQLSSSKIGRNPMFHMGFRNDEMNRTTAIDVFFVESIDNPSTPENENLYTWTPLHVDQTLPRIDAGFYWWVEVANVMQIWPPLSYIMTFRFPTDWQQQVTVEPITKNGDVDDYLWVLRITENHGVAIGYDSRTRTREYGARLRAWHSTQNGFPVFVIYNGDPAPSSYPNQTTAWAWFGDYVSLLFRNGTRFPPESTGWVMAHEVAHVFWACDEYTGHPHCQPSCENCYRLNEGPRPNQENLNCDLCPSSVHTDCIMRDINEFTWTYHSTCGITRLAIGWPY